MKKFLYILTASLLLCACGRNTMSLDDARKAVLKDANLNEGDVSFSREEQGNGEYIFEFSDDKNKYSYTVGENGTISSRNHSSKTQDKNELSTSKNGSDELTETNDTQNNNTSINKTTYITEDEAINIALKAYGFTKDQVTDIDVDDEEENGIYIYRVEFHRENQEYEVDVNRENGQIVNKNIQKDDRKVV